AGTTRAATTTTPRRTSTSWPGSSPVTARATGSASATAGGPTPRAPGSGRPLSPTRGSTHELRPVGGLRPPPPPAVAHARRQRPRARRRDRAAQRARRLYPAPGGGLDLGRAGRRHHRVQPGREGLLLRPGRRQGIPAPHLLRGARGRGAPVNAPVFE